MALWRVRQGEQTWEDLTFYQLQELIRAGQVRADGVASSDGLAWQPVAENPKLARALPEVAAAMQPEAEVNGLPLRRTEDGKLLPPSDEAIAEFLAKHRTAPDRVPGAFVTRTARVVIAVVSIIATVACVFIMRRLLADGIFTR